MEVSRRRVNVLCVGLTVVDLITVADHYPQEDSDQRGQSFRRQRGGNAANNCTILSNLGMVCEFLGVLPPKDDPECRWLMEDFAAHSIKTSSCVHSCPPCRCPVANVIISASTGSRTILFCRQGHPELGYEDFVTAVDDRLSQFSWIHFELRGNADDNRRMMEFTHKHRAAARNENSKSCSGGDSMTDSSHTCTTNSYFISVEIEKPEFQNPEQAMGLADVVFISKDWARHKGWGDMTIAVEAASSLCKPHCIVVCPWEEKGAAAWHNNTVLTANAVPPSQVVDTLGAGDTFVGAFIHSMSQQMYQQSWTTNNPQSHTANVQQSSIGQNLLADQQSPITNTQLKEQSNVQQTLQADQQSWKTNAPQSHKQSIHQSQPLSIDKALQTGEQSQETNTQLKQETSFRQLQQCSVQQALELACHVAAYKCSVQGYEGVKLLAKQNFSNLP